MAIDLTTTRLQPPAVEHGALAAARLPFIQANDAAALAVEAKALGFRKVAADQYTHADGSWLVMANGRVERGYQGVHFRGVPVDLTQLPVAAPGAFGNRAAVAMPQSMPKGGRAAFKTLALRHGFQEILPNYFSHPDGSWVAIVDGKPIRGINQSGLHPSDGPQAAPRSPRAARPPRAPAGGSAGRATNPVVELLDKAINALGGPQGEADAAASTRGARPRRAGSPAGGSRRSGRAIDDNTIASYRQVAPSFEDGFLACAQLPFLDPNNLAADRTVFKDAGFKEKAPGYFEHADTSWVFYSQNGGIERGVGKQVFQGVPIGPGRMQQATPGFAEMGLAVAAPELAGINAAKITASDKVLLDLGFKKITGAYYSHADGSFVAFVSGKPRFGNQGVVFDAQPGIGGMAKIKSNEAHVWLAVAQTGSLKADDARLGEKLEALGFAAAGSGVYSHPDTSFVAVVGGQLVRGVGGEVLTDLPKAPKAGSVRQYNALPSNTWSWWQQNTALGRLPIIGNDSNGRAVLEQAGFRKVSAAGGVERWQHKDGSWAELDGGVRCGWQKWELGELPFQRS
ncbi:MAG: hypothetical protein HY903_03115 [Deltaproteobacteria bacterium]|nr:hypothetical protein [Deltaproteobacteria bacterium]